MSHEPKVEPRQAARVRAFELVYELQAGVDGTFEALTALVADAKRNHWPEVTRVGLFGQAVRGWLRQDRRVGESVSAFLAASEEGGDTAMLALALALRSDPSFLGDTPPGDVADLARAVVLLEGAEGGALERITAHTACGIAFANRTLFELADEQYQAAIEIGEKEQPGSVDFLLAPIMFNRAELEVAWASVLRQLGDDSAIALRSLAWQAVTEAASRYTFPESWTSELDALGMLLESIAGVDKSAEAAAVLGRIDPAAGDAPRTIGLLLLAGALGDAAATREGARTLAERATRALDPDLRPQIHELALCLVAEIEAADGSDAGLRYARRQFSQRWANHLESLRTMEATIRAERTAHEREILSAHAFLDDLTGIANRRALDQFLRELPERQVRDVAIIMIDIDGFKKVNDLYGHLAGDAVLIAIARAVSRSIHVTDLAVRLGGDEFAAILSDVDFETAAERTRTVAEAINEESLEEAAAPGLVLTLSVGFATGNVSSLTELWGKADAAMYQAKAGAGVTLGRSRIASERDRRAG